MMLSSSPPPPPPLRSPPSSAAPPAAAAAAPAAPALPAPLERARAFFCWRAREKAYLGLGSMLYLNAVRWMALVFAVLGFIAAPRAVANAAGERVALANGDGLEYAAARFSLANLGARGWTPGGGAGGAGACSGNGFAASVCLEWSAGATDALDFACGSVPANVPLPNIAALQRSLLTYELIMACARPATLCECFPGWSGAACDAPAPAPAGGGGDGANASSIPGFCVPPALGAAPWWTLAAAADREAVRKAAEAARAPGVCSGAGGCAVRVSAADATVPAFAFVCATRATSAPPAPRRRPARRRTGPLTTTRPGQTRAASATPVRCHR